MGHYDVAQVCLNGHTITRTACSSPEFTKKFCPKCGEQTITACPRCKESIQGEYHAEGIVPIGFGDPPPPNFCHNCGAPYPWTQRTIQSAQALADEFDDLYPSEREKIKQSLDDLYRDTPQTEVAAVRFTKIMANVGKQSYAAMREIIIGVLSQAARDHFRRLTTRCSRRRLRRRGRALRRWTHLEHHSTGAYDMTHDQLRALVFLSQTHRRLHEQRIKRSFRIIVSTLGFFALCAAAKFAPGANTKLPTGDCFFKAVVWITFGGLWGVAAIDFWGSRDANKINQQIAERAEGAVISYLNFRLRLSGSQIGGIPKPDRHPRRFAWVWETLIVLEGAVASAYAITCL